MWPLVCMRYSTSPRMFYNTEAFMSNIRDSNPMRSIMRKCAILHTSDYIRMRPTDIPEVDVFLCESQYNEAEKFINQMKSLKSFQLSDDVVRSEIFYLPHELHLYKSPSPELFTKTPPLPLHCLLLPLFLLLFLKSNPRLSPLSLSPRALVHSLSPYNSCNRCWLLKLAQERLQFSH